MKARPFAATLAVILAAASSAQAADAEAGRRIADRWCTACHVVSGSGASGGTAGSAARGTDAVPTLVSIARDPNRGPDWLRQWLTSPHPPMPDLNLSRAEIDDVVAYLQGLSR